MATNSFASTILSSETLASEQAFQAHSRKALIVLQQFHHIFGASGISTLALKSVTDRLINTMVSVDLLLLFT